MEPSRMNEITNKTGGKRRAYVQGPEYLEETNSWNYRGKGAGVTIIYRMTKFRPWPLKHKNHATGKEQEMHHIDIAVRRRMNPLSADS